VQTIEERQGLMISSPEEIAFHRGYISADEVRELAKDLGNTSYSSYLLALLDHQDTREQTRPPQTSTQIA
jgi:glucose-1-phosphate thymidylyltransferase